MEHKKLKKAHHSYHHGDLKTTLLEAALKMLRSTPPNEISLRELARTAGVSQAAPYRHFKNKEELLVALAIQGFEIKLGYIKESMEAHSHEPLQMYYHSGLSYFKMGLKHPQHFKLMFSSDFIPNEERPELMQAATKTFILFAEMIGLCQKSQIIGSGDPYQIALNCWTVIHGFTVLYAERRLECFGINEDIAESAVKSLMEQFLIGAKQPHKSIKLNFPFDIGRVLT